MFWRPVMKFGSEFSTHRALKILRIVFDNWKPVNINSLFLDFFMLDKLPRCPAVECAVPIHLACPVPGDIAYQTHVSWPCTFIAIPFCHNINVISSISYFNSHKIRSSTLRPSSLRASHNSTCILSCQGDRLAL